MTNIRMKSILLVVLILTVFTTNNISQFSNKDKNSHNEHEELNQLRDRETKFSVEVKTQPRNLQYTGVEKEGLKLDEFFHYMENLCPPLQAENWELKLHFYQSKFEYDIPGLKNIKVGNYNCKITSNIDSGDTIAENNDLTAVIQGVLPSTVQDLPIILVTLDNVEIDTGLKLKVGYGYGYGQGMMPNEKPDIDDAGVYWKWARENDLNLLVGGFFDFKYRNKPLKTCFEDVCDGESHDSGENLHLKMPKSSWARKTNINDPTMNYVYVYDECGYYYKAARIEIDNEDITFSSVSVSNKNVGNNKDISVFFEENLNDDAIVISSKTFTCASVILGDGECSVIGSTPMDEIKSNCNFDFKTGTYTIIIYVNNKIDNGDSTYTDNYFWVSAEFIISNFITPEDQINFSTTDVSFEWTFSSEVTPSVIKSLTLTYTDANNVGIKLGSEYKYKIEPVNGDRTKLRITYDTLPENEYVITGLDEHGNSIQFQDPNNSNNSNNSFTIDVREFSIATYYIFRTNEALLIPINISASFDLDLIDDAIIVDVTDPTTTVAASIVKNNSPKTLSVSVAVNLIQKGVYKIKLFNTANSNEFYVLKTFRVYGDDTPVIQSVSPKCQLSEMNFNFELTMKEKVYERQFIKFFIEKIGVDTPVYEISTSGLNYDATNDKLIRIPHSKLSPGDYDFYLQYYNGENPYAANNNGKLYVYEKLLVLGEGVFTPAYLDNEENINFDINFNQNLVDGFVQNINLEPRNSGAVVHPLTYNTSPLDFKVAVSSSSTTPRTPGTYRFTAQDICGNPSVSTQKYIHIIDRQILSFSQMCFEPTQDITITVKMSSIEACNKVTLVEYYTTAIDKLPATDLNKNNCVLTMELSFKLPNNLAEGEYPLYFTTDPISELAKNYKVRINKIPLIKNSVTYNTKLTHKSMNGPFFTTINFAWDFFGDEIVSVYLERKAVIGTTDYLFVRGSFTKDTPSSLRVDFDAILQTGDFTLYAQDYCGNSYEVGVYRILNVPYLTQFNSAFVEVNTQISTVAQFDYDVSQYTASNAVVQIDDLSGTPIELIMTDLPDKNQKRFTRIQPFDLPIGVYYLTTTTGNVSIEYLTKLYVLSTLNGPVVTNLSRTVFSINQDISFQIKFQKFILIEEIVYLRLVKGSEVINLTLEDAIDNVLYVKLPGGIKTEGMYSILLYTVNDKNVYFDDTITIFNYKLSNDYWYIGKELNMSLMSSDISHPFKSFYFKNTSNQLIPTDMIDVNDHHTEYIIKLLPGLTAVGKYSLFFNDFNNFEYPVGNLEILSLPVIQSVDQKCVIKDTHPLFLTLTLQNEIRNRQFSLFEIRDQSNTKDANSVSRFTYPTLNQIRVQHATLATPNSYSLMLKYTKTDYTQLANFHIIDTNLDILNFTQLWDAGKIVDFSITFNQILQAGHIVEVKLIADNDQDNIINLDFVDNFTTFVSEKMTRSTTVVNPAKYKVYVKDFCDNEFTTTDTIDIRAIPTIIDVEGLCFSKSEDVSVNIEFSTLIVPNQIKAIKLVTDTTDDNLRVSSGFTLGNINGEKMSATHTAANLVSAAYFVDVYTISDTLVRSPLKVRLLPNLLNDLLLTSGDHFVRSDYVYTTTMVFDRNIVQEEIMEIYVETALYTYVDVKIEEIKDNTIRITVPRIANVGDYKLYMTDFCNNKIDAGNYKVVNLPMFKALDVLYVDINNFQVQASFDREFTDSELIKYLRVFATPVESSLALNPAIIELTYVDSYDNDTKKIEIADDALPIGIYELSFKDQNGLAIEMVANAPRKLYVLETTGDLTITEYTPLKGNAGVPINLEITFTTNLIREQITQVKFTHDSGQEFDFTISKVLGKKVFVNLTGAVMKAGTFRLSGKTINGANFSTGITYTHFIPLSVETITPVCTLLNIAYEFTTTLNKSSGYNIIRGYLTDSADNRYVLALTSNGNGVVTSSVFGLPTAGIYTLNLVDESQFIVQSSSIIAMSKLHEIVSISKNQFEVTDMISFEIVFDRVIEEKYITGIYLTDINGVAHKMIIERQTNYSVFVTYPERIINSPYYTLNVYMCNGRITGKQITINYPAPPVAPQIPKCDVGLTYDSLTKSCVACHLSKQFYLNGECILACPATTKIYADHICVESCEIYGMVSYLTKCVESCPAYYVPYLNMGCQSCKTLGLFELNATCVKQCPINFDYNKDTNQCYKLINLIDENQLPAECDENTCNGGTCRVTYTNQIDCNCPAGRTGLLCEIETSSLNLSQMNTIVQQIVSQQNPENTSYSLAMTADNYLQAKSEQLFSNTDSQLIYIYTTNVLIRMADNKIPLDANVIKLTNLALSMKILQYKKAVARLRRLEGETVGPVVDENTTNTNLMLVGITTTPNDTTTTKDQVVENTNTTSIITAVPTSIPVNVIPPVSQNIQLDNIKSDIKTLIAYTIQFVDSYINSNRILNQTSSIIWNTDLLNIQIGFSNGISQANFNLDSSNNNLALVDPTECFKSLRLTGNYTQDSNFIMHKVEVSNTLNELIEKPQNSSNTVFFDVKDFTTRQKVDLSQCKEATAMKFKYPMDLNLVGVVNVQEYRRFKAIGVNIFDPTERMFNSRCHHLENFYPFDTTENYRRFKIFQNLTYSCPDSGCTYEGLDDNEYAVCACNNAADSNVSGLNSKLVSTIFKPTSNINLELIRCPDVAFIHTQVYRNAGFWISLLVILSLIVLFIRHYYLHCNLSHENPAKVSDMNAVEMEKMKQTEVYPKTVGNPGLETNNAEDDKLKVHTHKSHNHQEDEQLKLRQIKLEITTEKNFRRQDTRGFGNTFTKVLFEIHPILSLCKNTFNYTFDMKAALFIFVSFMYFSLNAFIFTDTYIEMRMLDNTRDNFGYTMKSEFGKIFASIIITCILSIIFRLIVRPTEEVRSETNSTQSDYALYRQLSCKYVIAWIFIFTLSLFFFYYNFVFCAVYWNASAGWVYSGLWSLGLVWFVFSPFVILLITLFECESGESNGLVKFVTLPLRLLF